MLAMIAGDTNILSRKWSMEACVVVHIVVIDSNYSTHVATKLIHWNARIILFVKHYDILLPARIGSS